MDFNNISAWSIRNPIVPLLAFIALVTVGIFAFQDMDIQDQPDIEFPQVQVSISQPGAAPTEVVNQITQRVEAAVESLDGVVKTESTASEGSSTTMIEFELGTDIAEAVNEVKSRVDQIRSELPDGILEPRIAKQGTSSSPLVYFGVSAQDMTLEQLSWFIDDSITKRLLTVEGLAEVNRSGGVSREILVILDPNKVQALGITAAQVNNALRQLNVNAAGGRTEIAGARQSVRVLGNAGSAYDLSQTQIAIGAGRSVKLADIAKVSDAYGELTSLSKIDGKQVVTFSISRAIGESDVRVYDEAMVVLDKIEAENPGITFTRLFTEVDYVKAQYESSMAAMIEGAILAVIVVFLFLRDWRATIISALAIPLSAIPTFYFMEMLGFTLNTLSLLALGLVAGVLVDDAIVEIENIVRHMRMGKSAYQASIDAADEIGLAVVATTFTIIAVFLPVGLMPGVSGQFFKNFGLTVVVSVLMSLVVARMITPMIAAYFLKAKGHASHGEGKWMDRYMAVLRWTLDRKESGRIRKAAGKAEFHWSYALFATPKFILIGLTFVAGFIGVLYLVVTRGQFLIDTAYWSESMAAMPSFVLAIIGLLFGAFLVWCLQQMGALSGFIKGVAALAILTALYGILSVIYYAVADGMNLFDGVYWSEYAAKIGSYLWQGTAFIISLAMLLMILLAGSIAAWLAAYGVGHVMGFASVLGGAHYRTWFLNRKERFSGRLRDHRLWMIGVGALALSATVLIALDRPQQFFPGNDSDFSMVQVSMVPGTTLEQTEKTITAIAERMKQEQEVELALGIVNEGSGMVRLVLREDRVRKSLKFEQEMTPVLQDIPDARVSFRSDQGGPGGTGRAITIMLAGSDTDVLDKAAVDLHKQMGTVEGAVAPRIEYTLQRPELIIKPREDLAASLGVTTQSLSQAIRIATIGDIDRNAAKFSLADRQIPIRVRLAESERRSVSTINNLPVPTSNGGSVPLSSVAEISFGMGPTSIERLNRSMRIFVGVDIEAGVARGDVLTAINNLPIMQDLPEGVTNLPVGSDEWQQDLISNFIIALATGVMLVFSVLVLLYRRLVSPLVNMASLSLAPLGGLIMLWAVDQPISLPVFIGVLMLLGIVGKNSILLIDFALEEMAQGKGRYEAIIEAGHKRAQPIVMTTIAMTAGMVPTAISLSGDSAWRAPMGTVVIGGLIFSTLLTLLIVPAGFSLADGLEKKLGPWLRKNLLTIEAGDDAPPPEAEPAE